MLLLKSDELGPCVFFLIFNTVTGKRYIEKKTEKIKRCMPEIKWPVISGETDTVSDKVTGHSPGLFH